MNCTISSDSSYETGDNSTSLSLSLFRSEERLILPLFAFFFILCFVPLVILICAMLRKFDILERIIGLNLVNNRKTLGKIWSTIAQQAHTQGGFGWFERTPLAWHLRTTREQHYSLYCSKDR